MELELPDVQRVEVTPAAALSVLENSTYERVYLVPDVTADNQPNWRDLRAMHADGFVPSELQIVLNEDGTWKATVEVVI